MNEFSDKKKESKGLDWVISYVACEYLKYSTTKSKVIDMTFKLPLIHDSVIFKIHWISITFRENSNGAGGNVGQRQA